MPSPFERAWMYQQSSGSLSELTFEADESGAVATSISNSGIIGGQEVPPKGMPLPGYWTTTGGAALLTIDYDAWTEATGANNTGVIVGWWGASGSPGSGAVAWSGPDYAVETDLPHLPCDQCDRLPVQVNAVNDAGEIVGESQSASGSSRAFVYVNGQMYDLNSLIDPTTSIPASTTLSNAVSINSNGWIAVNATVTTTGPYGDNGTTTTETVNAPNAYLLIPSH